MKLSLWDPKTRTTRESREYVQHDIVSTALRDEYFDRPEMRSRRFYEDTETGLLVADVEQYETWLATLGTKTDDTTDDVEDHMTIDARYDREQYDRAARFGRAI